MPRYRWEPDAGITGRYRDTKTGRFLSNKAVRADLDAYLADSDDVMKALAETLRAHGVSLADAELILRREIKRVHLSAVAFERGGWANMTARDYGLAGQRIRYNYGKARDMFIDIGNKKQRLDGTLASRFQLYTEAGRNTFYRSKQANIKPGGPTHVRSKRSARDSCVECVYLDGRIFTIGDPTYKLPGQRICLSRCRCSEEYLSLNGDGYQVLEVA